MKISRAIIFLSTSLLFSSVASASMLYVGASSSGSHMDFKNDFGDTLAPNGVNRADTIYAGATVYDDTFGLEVGTSYLKSGSFKAEIEDDDPEFGIPDYTGIGDDTFNNKLKMDRLYVQAYKEFAINDKVSLSPYIGMSYVKAKLSVEMILVDGLAVGPVVAAANNFTAKDSKLVPKLGLHMNIKAAKNYGFRFGLGYENTSRLKLKTFDIPGRVRNGQTLYPEARPKDTYSIELGFYINPF
jgi:hypothetical protein